MFGLLTAAGYETGVFGKTTNDQIEQLQRLAQERSATYIDSPIQYNDFNGLRYYHLLPNGTQWTETLSTVAPSYGTTYQTTQLGNRSLLWLDSVLGGRAPWFLYLGPHAPHYPAGGG
eukprot:gene48471-11234_t